LLGKDGAGIGKLGYVADLPDDTTVNSSLLVIRPDDGLLDHRYLFYYLKGPQFQDIALQRITESTTPHLFQKDIRRLRVLVPPIPEQCRIVVKVKELLTYVTTLRQRLGRVRKILKAFRQAVLVAACSGRLTADWRENNSDVEPSSALLLRIKEWRLNSASTKKERLQITAAFDTEGRLPSEEDVALLGIPESWTRCSVGAIGAVCNGSTPSRNRVDFWGGQIPWVSSGEVRNNSISETREKITAAGYENSSLRLLPCGTVLIAMIGEGKTRGQSAVLNTEATINQNIAAVTLQHSLVRPQYLWYWFQFQYQETRQRGGGSGPQALNCDRVRELPFALPPFKEQHEIIRRLEALFKLAEKVEKRVTAGAARVEKLTQAILAKAFQGELVPTEAELARREGRDYEPASVLLDRIKSERANGAASDIERRRRSVAHSRRASVRDSWVG
jgi:type I restriction enzyme, S subunit